MSKKTRNTEEAIVVGRFHEKMGLWSAFKAVSRAPACQNGVLVVHAKNSSGRIGIADGAVITGAVVDSQNISGEQAIKDLLRLPKGRYCFRPSIPGEDSELNQNLSGSVSKLMELHVSNAELKIDEAFFQCINISQPEADGEQQSSLAALLADEDNEDEEQAVEEATSNNVENVREPEPNESEPASVAAVETGEAKSLSPFDYLEGFEPSSDATRTSFSRLIPIKRNARSESAPAGEQKQLSDDLQTYKQVIQEEKAKVYADLQRTLELASLGEPVSESVEDLLLAEGMLHSQEKLIENRWQGLDDIPTPKASQSSGDPTVSGRHTVRPASDWIKESGRHKVMTAAELAACDELVTTGRQNVDQKQFLKTGSKSLAGSYFWLQDPRFMYGVTAVLLVGIVYGFAQGLHMMATERRLNEGLANLDNNRWNAAIVCFSDALREAPDCGRAYFYRAIAELESAKLEQAETDFKAAIANNYSKEQVLLARASLSARQYKWQEALDYCNKAAESGSASAQVFWLRGKCYGHLKDWTAAIRDYDKALALTDDKNLIAHIQSDKGIAAFNNHDAATSAASYSAALQAAPSKDGYKLHGNALLTAKKFREATDDYAKVIALDPKDYDAYVARGICEAKVGNTDAALRDFYRALQLNPDGVEAHLERGTVLMQRGAYRLALSDLQDAYKLNAHEPRIRKQLTEAYGKLRETVPKDLLASSSTLNESRSTANGTTHSAGSNDIAPTSGAFKLPATIPAMITAGYNYLQQNSIDEAMACFNEVVKRAPGNTAAHRYLAHALMAAERPAEAANQFRFVETAHQMTAADTVAYAKALSQSGNTQRAAGLLLNVVQADPSNGSARITLVKLYLQSGQAALASKLCAEGINVTAKPQDKHELESLMRGGNGSSTTGGGTNSNAQHFGGGG